MSPHMPFVTGDQVERVAQEAGYLFDRKTGSHVVYFRDSDKRRIVIPIHAGKILKPKTLAAIVRDMGLTMDEFRVMIERNR